MIPPALAGGVSLKIINKKGEVCLTSPLKA